MTIGLSWRLGVAAIIVRFRPAFWRRRRVLLTRANLTDRQILERARHLIAEALTRAAVTSPFYRRFGLANHRDRHLVLTDFPTTERQDLGARFADFLARGADGIVPLSGRAHIFRTSGSTGRPVTLLYDDEQDTETTGVFYSRLFQRHSLPHSGSYIDLGLRYPGEPLTSIRPNIGIYRGYHLSRYQPEFAPHIEREYLWAAETTRPTFLFGTPSRLVQFGRILISRGRRCHPNVVFSSYEYLSLADREWLERCFNCKVVNLYGCSETGMIAWECTQRNFHIEADMVSVEVLDEGRRPVNVGEVGDVFATPLHSRVMPLIRYRIGDRATWGGTGCTCGSNLPYLSQLVGRTASPVLASDGRAVSEYYIADRLANIGCSDFQIVQRKLGELIIICPVGSFVPKQDEARAAREISAYMREDMRLLFESTGAYIYSDNGKRNTTVISVHSDAG